MSNEQNADNAAPLGSGRPNIYGDYVAPAVASGSSPWHIQGSSDAPALTLCGERLPGYLRRMRRLHVSLLECSTCMKMGGSVFPPAKKTDGGVDR